MRYFILTISILLFSSHELPRKAVRVANIPTGLFAEFLWAVNHLHWCHVSNLTPVIYWGPAFAYYSPQGYNGSLNGWEYYFEPVSDSQYEKGDEVHSNWYYIAGFSTVWPYPQYIDQLHLLPVEEQSRTIPIPLPCSFAAGKKFHAHTHIYDPHFRKIVFDIIERYIKIKSPIKKKIDDFYETHFQGKHVVGIHLRGKFIWNEVDEVPLEYICEEANRRAQENTVFYIATDQAPLIEQAQKLLCRPAVFYPCYRQATTTSPWIAGQWPPEMGEDVLVEAVLLSRCDYFVHTISNLSTAVLFF